MHCDGVGCNKLIRPGDKTFVHSVTKMLVIGGREQERTWVTAVFCEDCEIEHREGVISGNGTVDQPDAADDQ